MKIAQVAPPVLSVPPKKYGGTEKIVSHLTEALVERGHEVILYASGDSRTKARLKFTYKKAIGIDYIDPVHYFTHTINAYRDAEKEGVDIIHNHTGQFGIAWAMHSNIPTVTTLHNDYLLIPRTPQQKLFCKTTSYVAISKNQKKRLKGLNFIDVVYNCIDINVYAFSEEKGDYLFFIGNIVPHKGPDIAVKIAKELNEKLIMVGKIDKVQEPFFNEKIKPYVDNKNIFFYTDLPLKKIVELYQHAKCLIFPLQWEEPFGLVMAEAQSCGTPVVAFNRGSVPEVVKHGVTGFVVKTYEEFLKAIENVDKISPKKCRKWVEKMFTIEKMVKHYERVYEKVLSKEGKSS
ncbi:MAG TPA: glycosyltransferase family 4 protein [Candidatus Aenigmarchaeota archaeon]|nr:MAG: glycosyltransferase family 4 protein [Candidatus Aenigmarchaeota archaeon]HDD46400.1 glycosyltransferase family 4 protein [Candidatus Aenigmarchaeota archaeon]